VKCPAMSNAKDPENRNKWKGCVCGQHSRKAKKPKGKKPWQKAPRRK
jgi:hypothetical protein